MEISSKQLWRVELIELSGRVDSKVGAPLLEKALKSLTDAGRFRLVVDMRNQEYISARGLRALLATLKEVKRWNRGDLRLCNVPPRIQGVLDLAGLTPDFKIYAILAEAVESF